MRVKERHHKLWNQACIHSKNETNEPNQKKNPTISRRKKRQRRSRSLKMEWSQFKLTHKWFMGRTMTTIASNHNSYGYFVSSSKTLSILLPLFEYAARLWDSFFPLMNVRELYIYFFFALVPLPLFLLLLFYSSLLLLLFFLFSR